MKDKFFLLVGIVVIVGSFYLFLQKPAPQHYQKEKWQTEEIGFPDQGLKARETYLLSLGPDGIFVEVADTPEERTLGLSGRESLEKHSGLLFLFEVPGKHGFWMKDMNFPIDIVWIDENWVVVGVERGVKPGTYPRTFYPPASVKYVLELNSGEAAELGIDTGLEMSLVR
jgi:uncharacterized protein